MINHYPETPIGQLYANCRNALASCPAFMSFCNSADKASALNRVYLEGFPSPPDNNGFYTLEQFAQYLPGAVIVLPDPQNGIKRDCVSCDSRFTTSGAVQVFFDAPVPSDQHINNVPKAEFLRNFCTHVSQIIMEMERRVTEFNDAPPFQFHGSEMFSLSYTDSSMVPNTGLYVRTCVQFNF